MFTIAGTVLWIILDLGMFLMTTPPAFPPWLWYGFLIAGLIVGIVALIGELRDRKADAAEMAGLKAGQNALAGAALKNLEAGSNLALLVEKLEGLTDTHGKPLAITIEMANEKIERLAAKVYRHDAIFWGVLDPNDKRALTTTLIGLGPHSVTVVPDANMDCCELARDIKGCFKEARWTLAPVQLTGTYWSAGASGLSAIFKFGREALQQPIVSALSLAAHGQCMGIGSGPPSPSEGEKSDVTVIVGPKRIHYDDD